MRSREVPRSREKRTRFTMRKDRKSFCMSAPWDAAECSTPRPFKNIKKYVRKSSSPNGKPSTLQPIDNFRVIAPTNNPNLN